MIPVVKRLDTLVDRVEHTGNVDYLLAQTHSQARKRRARFIANIRHHRHELEPAAQCGIQQRQRAVRGVHCADDVDVGRN